MRARSVSACNEVSVIEIIRELTKHQAKKKDKINSVREDLVRLLQKEISYTVDIPLERNR